MKKYYFKCPKCGSSDCFEHVQQESPSFLEFSFIWPSLVGKRRRVQCTNCKYIFGMPGIPLSPISKLSVSIIGILTLAIVGTLLLTIEPDLLLTSLNHEFFKFLENYISQNTKAVTVGMSMFMLLLIPLLFISSVLGEYVFRKNFKTKFRTNPE